MSKVFIAKSVEKGIGIGNILRLYDMSDVRRSLIKEVNDEIEKFYETIEKAKEEYLSLIEDNDSNVFKDQLKMLDDLAWQKLVKDNVLIYQLELRYSIKQAFEEAKNKLLEENNALKTQRAIDIEDISTRLIRIIDNKEEIDYSHLVDEVVIVTNSLLPSHLELIDKKIIQAIIVKEESSIKTNIPTVSDIDIEEIDGLNVIVDGSKGIVIVDPREDTINNYRIDQIITKRDKQGLKDYIDKKTITQDKRELNLICKVETLRDLETAKINDADGIYLLNDELELGDYKKEVIYKSKISEIVDLENVTRSEVYDISNILSLILLERIAYKYSSFIIDIDTLIKGLKVEDKYNIALLKLLNSSIYSINKHKKKVIIKGINEYDKRYFNLIFSMGATSIIVDENEVLKYRKEVMRSNYLKLNQKMQKIATVYEKGELDSFLEGF